MNPPRRSQKEPAGSELNIRPGACEATLTAAGLVSYACIPGSPCRQFYGDIGGIFGEEIDPDALESTPWEHLVHEEDRGLLLAACQPVQPGEPYRLQYRLKLPGGRIVPVEDSGALTPDPETGHYRHAGILADISRQQTLEERLRYVHRMEAFGQLTSGVAHDFNNLLTLLRGYAELLQDELPRDGGCAGEYLQEMIGAADRAVELARQLQIFCRLPPPAPGFVWPGTRVMELRRILRRMVGAEVEFVIDIAEESGCVKVAPSQIDAIVVRMVAHAREGLPPGSRLGLSVYNQTIPTGDSRVRREGWNPGDYLVISVDTRRARSESPLSAIPLPESESLEEARELWIACGGRLEQQGEVEDECRTLLFLPRIEPPTAPAPTPPRAESAVEGKGETLLLVEDDPETLHLYSTGIERLGYRVLRASHGEEALRLADANPEIDLVLSDLIMPLMGGVELAGRVRSVLPSAAIILMSGYSPGGSRSEPGRYQGYPFLSKPFSLKHLASKLRECIENR